jgi:hypothetical protein
LFSEDDKLIHSLIIKKELTWSKLIWHLLGKLCLKNLNIIFWD